MLWNEKRFHLINPDISFNVVLYIHGWFGPALVNRDDSLVLENNDFQKSLMWVFFSHFPLKMRCWLLFEKRTWFSFTTGCFLPRLVEIDQMFLIYREMINNRQSDKFIWAFSSWKLKQALIYDMIGLTILMKMIPLPGIHDNVSFFESIAANCTNLVQSSFNICITVSLQILQVSQQYNNKSWEIQFFDIQRQIKNIPEDLLDE